MPSGQFLSELEQKTLKFTTWIQQVGPEIQLLRSSRRWSSSSRSLLSSPIAKNLVIFHENLNMIVGCQKELYCFL